LIEKNFSEEFEHDIDKSKLSAQKLRIEYNRIFFNDEDSEEIRRVVGVELWALSGAAYPRDSKKCIAYWNTD
jgi:hypothetical protein